MDSPFETRIAEALTELSTDPNASLRAVAKKFSLSAETLRRRQNGGIGKQIARNSQQLLSPEQEQELVQWILHLEMEGHAPTHNTVRAMASRISQESGASGRIGHHWLQRFLTRQPAIRSKLGRKIEVLRIENTKADSLRTFFELFRRVRKEYKVADEDIWNMDETGLALGSSAHQQVLGRSATSRTYKKSPENREWVSTVETISAAGRSIPCLVIFKGKNIQSSWFEADSVPDWHYTTSERGWTSNDIGKRWLQQIFIPHTQPKITGASRILLMDNQGSHIPTDFMWICFQNNIRLLYMPAHSSHVLQPLDLAVFSRLKSSYRAQIEKLAKYENAAPIKKIRFVKYYNQARQDALKEIYIRAGWRGTGLVPWNPQKVLKSSQISQDSCTPKTPKKRPHSAIDDTLEVLKTPENRRQLVLSQNRLLQTQKCSQKVRILFEKTAKAFDQFHVANVRNLDLINAQATKLDEINAKKQKVAVADSNEMFANIESIMAAQEEQARRQKLTEARDLAAEARKTANKVINMTIDQMTTVFSQFEAVE